MILAQNLATRTSSNGNVTLENKSTETINNLTATSLFTGLNLTSLLQNPAIACEHPYVTLESLLPFTAATRFWWHITAIPLSKLMTRMCYPLPLHYRYLTYYYDIMLPGYGQIPSRASKAWTATLTPDSSAFEPSWNLQTTGTHESIVRFTIEPHSEASGSDADPLNQKGIEKLVQRAAATDTGVDTELFRYVTSALFISDEEGRKLRKRWPEHFPPQAYLAFDFEKTGRIMAKGSFFFMWKAKQTERAPRDLAFELITGIPVIGPAIIEPLNVWYTWLTEFPVKYGGEPRVEGMGFDLLTPGPQSRIKIYSRLWNTSFGAVSYFYTLGNRLQDSSTTKGLELLKLFWVVVCGIQDDKDFMSKEVPVSHQDWADIVVNWEFKVGEALPRPKLYAPLGKWLQNNGIVSERLREFWRRLGWSEMAETYTKDWKDILYVYSLHSYDDVWNILVQEFLTYSSSPWHDEEGDGGMTFVSFAYKDDDSGLYMSLYFSPKVHTAVEKRVGLI
jgi:DMATS type aromatic prenyltransferase